MLTFPTRVKSCDRAFFYKIFRKYPVLKSAEAESIYRSKYDEDYARFHALKEQTQKVASKFDKMQEEMSRLVDGTDSYESFKEQVIQDYRKCVKDGYLKNVREYKETHLRKGLRVFCCLDYVMTSTICAGS